MKNGIPFRFLSHICAALYAKCGYQLQFQELPAR